MEPSILKRAGAIAVLVLVILVAIRLAVGLVVGLVTGLLWVLVVAALVGAGLWARSTLKSTQRKRAVQRPSTREAIDAPPEDRVAAEMRRITEQLREQGRR